MSERQVLRILIAEDNDSDRMILQAIVRKQGHHVVTAVDGVDAVEQFERERPQIVLLDALMPRMDGLEAARRIKELAGEELVPIIFLTSLTDAMSLADCLEAGGDDFLSKPYNRVILEAKIHAFNRMRLMHQTLQQQRDLIHQRNEQMLKEQRLARKVFDNIAHQGCLDASNIRYLISPMSVFNGDVLFACPRPSGGMHVFLGDFTGHGLPAAIGAMPLAEIFYGMTGKGFSIGDILREINQKLKRILPPGFFCCGVMAAMDLHTGEIEVWNGGLPDGYLLRNDGTRVVLASRHLPLGVLSAERFSSVCERYTLDNGERLLFSSDGVMEATGPDGEMFGEARLLATLDAAQQPEQGFTNILDAVTAFKGSSEDTDDLTLVELTMVDETAFAHGHLREVRSALRGPTRWRCEYMLENEALQQFNPLPLLLHICMEVPGLRHCSGQIYTVLAELYSNALEHGILGLDSAMKCGAEGFARYYSERERRLADIESAYIRVTLDHVPDDGGGLLRVTVEDSGPGFDISQFDGSGVGSEHFSGRGIGLLRELCARLTYEPPGNRVHAEFVWHTDRRVGSIPFNRSTR